MCLWYILHGKLAGSGGMLPQEMFEIFNCLRSFLVDFQTKNALLTLTSVKLFANLQIHERDKDTDFCMLVVRKLLRTNSKNVKVS